MRRLDHRLAGQERQRYHRRHHRAGGHQEGRAACAGDVRRRRNGRAGATVGVVVIGEKPYAEGAGDRTDLSLAPEDVTAIDNMKAAGIPFVVILFSGRPMILGDSLDKADAFIAAWLPGTEGDGIADVLFGDYKPTGKLSFAWPRSMDQYPHAKDTNPLFPGMG
jgi:beta-glucosidase